MAMVIGEQTWMAENLRAAPYADGTSIPMVFDTVTWEGLSNTDKACCWFNNNLSNAVVYGVLYTWAAAMNGETASDANPSGVRGGGSGYKGSDGSFNDEKAMLAFEQPHSGYHQ
jgi:uncharacterized protein (TIGR02145 family)